MLEIETERAGGAFVVVVRGEIDLAVSEQFRIAVQNAVEQAQHVVIDLSEAPSIDSVGLATLIGARKSARDVEIAVVLGSPNLRDVFELTGLASIVTVFDSRAAALAA